MHKRQKATVSALSIALIALLGTESIAGTPTIVTKQIANIRVSSGSSSDRVSILMGGATACGGSPGWFAFENADSGLGKSWLDALMMALVFGKQVTIVGTGTCDGFGVELINYIDFKPV